MLMIATQDTNNSDAVLSIDGVIQGKPSVNSDASISTTSILSSNVDAVRVSAALVVSAVSASAVSFFRSASDYLYAKVKAVSLSPATSPS